MKARELCRLSLIAALIIGGKEAMSALPNIEPVTLLLICTAIVYGWKALYPCLVFVLIEGLLYGFGWWFWSYLYVWPLLVAAVVLLRRVNQSYIVWTILAGVYGLCFGALTALTSLITGGPAQMFAYWISGLPYDFIHCAGNAVICGLLLRPLTRLLTRLDSRQNGT